MEREISRQTVIQALTIEMSNQRQRLMLGYGNQVLLDALTIAIQALIMPPLNPYEMASNQLN